MLYIFDMGGVVTTTAVLDEKLCRVLGISIEEFKRICGNKTGETSNQLESLGLFRLCSDGVIDSKEFWAEFSKRSGIAVKTDWFRYLFHPVLNEKTAAIIKKLRQAGNRVVCGTNTISAHYANHLERGDYAIFDQTYSSCHMGVSKPDKEFWRIILEAEEAQAADTVFIDDRKENCDAAAALGIHAVQFTTAEKLAEILGVEI
ncbi:HAD family hydrolase [Treponema sp.]|uniref:HAD family hydrolase n=1 Tax=Treponema sp. TaxID=166 RepID=UPI003F07654F